MLLLGRYALLAVVVEKNHKKELGSNGHKTFTLTTELQEQGTKVPILLKVGFEPTTKGCLVCVAQSSAGKAIFCYIKAADG